MPANPETPMTPARLADLERLCTLATRGTFPAEEGRELVAEVQRLRDDRDEKLGEVVYLRGLFRELLDARATHHDAEAACNGLLKHFGGSVESLPPLVESHGRFVAATVRLDAAWAAVARELGEELAT